MTRQPSHWFTRTFTAGSKSAAGSVGAPDVSETARVRTASLLPAAEKTGPAEDTTEPSQGRSQGALRSRTGAEVGGAGTLQLALLAAKAEALTEAFAVAHLYEKNGANAAAIRLALWARANTALKLVEELARLDNDPVSPSTGSSSSGAARGSTSSLAPRDNGDTAPLVAAAYDAAIRAVTPESRKAFPTRLRVVE